MIGFKQGERVRIVAHGSRPELNGVTGRVVRPLIRSPHKAWIKADADLPENCRSFPDPADERFRHTCVYDDECEAL
jgi:hypothetical protein